mmetsp:Transcript_72199/g.207276  ORF Transcript_72199/g.207276 Transcript_72199/m.207276 type:complete len:83 (-) Transcript_72199:109-357(-)
MLPRGPDAEQRLQALYSGKELDSKRRQHVAEEGGKLPANQAVSQGYATTRQAELKKAGTAGPFGRTGDTLAWIAKMEAAGGK